MAKGKKSQGGRKSETVPIKKKVSKQLTVNTQPWSARNLVKKDLAGVIFACKKATAKECMSKMLFGLPGAHFAYVQNVTPGMPLFLFNCTNRKLFGIFEAESFGKMNIDKYAWISDESETTPFPTQAEVNSRLQKLECQNEKPESSSRSVSDDCCESILLVGGFDGCSWLQDLVSYLPSEELIQPLGLMSSIRQYACSVELNGDLYVLGGGGHGASWYDTVESYNLRERRWTTCPNLCSRKGSLAGASSLGKIFAIGGGNETGCLSEVEVLDLDIGKWRITRSMLYKVCGKIRSSCMFMDASKGPEFKERMSLFDSFE